MTDWARPGGRLSIDSTNRNSKKIGFPAFTASASVPDAVHLRSVCSTNGDLLDAAEPGWVAAAPQTFRTKVVNFCLDLQNEARDYDDPHTPGCFRRHSCTANAD